MTHGAAMMDSMMMVLVMVKARRPGRGASKNIRWDTRNSDNNQGGNRDDSAKRHDQFLP
jgi:hypothetical protein